MMMMIDLRFADLSERKWIFDVSVYCCCNERVGVLIYRVLRYKVGMKIELEATLFTLHGPPSPLLFLTEVFLIVFPFDF
jgi:hypothetical protein